MAKTPAKEPTTVHCPECDRTYRRTELIRTSQSSPGMKRPGGGPNGSWRAVWRCCPKGHKLIRISFRIS